jgi:hypothetical protein
MNIQPPSPERDAALDAAWSANSREEPPSRLDAAVLAAAHRAVGSAPRDVAAPAAEATSPQRWWMPLAAAATIGAIALGILQLAPQEPAPTASVSDMAGTTAMPRDRLLAVERKDAAKQNADAAAASIAAATKSGAAASSSAAQFPSAPTGTAGAQPESATRLYALPTMKQETAPASNSVQGSSAPPATTTRTPSPARDTDDARGQRAEPSAPIAKRQAPPMPQAFPADAERRKMAGADSDEAARVIDGPAPDIASARSAAVPAAPSATITRGDAGFATDKLAKEADAVARTPATAPSAQLARTSPSGGGAAPAAKTAASAEATGVVAQDPDAWIARIRRLYDDGKQQDAAKELVAMRSAFPDADGRLPESMRAWAATVKP